MVERLLALGAAVAISIGASVMHAQSNNTPGPSQAQDRTIKLLREYEDWSFLRNRIAVRTSGIRSNASDFVGMSSATLEPATTGGNV